jgi:tetrahydromethanopterin S-methyltransferase subunit F
MNVTHQSSSRSLGWWFLLAVGIVAAVVLLSPMLLFAQAQR